MKSYSVDKIPESIIIFGEPLIYLLDAEGCYEKREFDHCMRIVISVWNAVTLDSVENTNKWTTSLLEHSKDGPPEMAAMVKLLIERKRTMLNNDVRAVGEHWIKDRAGDLMFGCDARDVANKYSKEK